MVDATGSALEKYMNLLSVRQKLIASNIANADTPGYKARDVDFASSLAGALKKTGGGAGVAASNHSTLAMAQPAGVTGGMSMAATTPGHMSGKTTLAPSGGTPDDYSKLQYRIPTQPALDGNTVDIDTERVQFADNTLHFESGMTVLSSQIKTMLAAIQSGS
jgi:flagellar basal-body rod protein FlgB